MPRSFIETMFSTDAWQLFGRFHVLTVHLPIGLLLVGGIVELYAMVKRKPSPSPAAEACILIGAFSAVISALMGWAHADYTPFAGQAETLFYHRWVGVASAGVACVVLVLQQRAKQMKLGEGRGGVWIRSYQVGAIVSAIVVGIAGHFGGQLTHGADNFSIDVAEAKPREVGSSLRGGPGTFGSVQPIFEASCYNCHSAGAQKGGLRLDSAAAILKGGASGPAVMAGDSGKSLLIDRVLGLGDEQRMPPKGPALSAKQIGLLKRWIEEGAKE